MKTHQLLARSLRMLVVLCGLPLLLAAPAIASAEDVTPDVLVKKVTDDVIDIIRKDKEIQSGRTHKAVELIEARVLPNFDFNHMTALAMGRDWRSATPEQKKALTDEFHTLLVRTYSKALSEYKDQTIDFKPFKMAPGDTDVQVRTEIKQPGAKPIQLSYYLQKQDNGWKFYDIEVAGVSLVTNYRDQFKQEISAGGIDGLIKSLRAKNQAPVATVKK